MTEVNKKMLFMSVVPLLMAIYFLYLGRKMRNSEDKELHTHSYVITTLGVLDLLVFVGYLYVAFKFGK